MRKISRVFDYKQIVAIFILVFLYFLSVGLIFGHSIANFIFFLVSFFATVIFFYISGRLYKYQVSILSLVATWCYSLFPTVLWFSITAVLFILFPPPRTQSFLGTLLSLVFIGISVVLLLWKITLVYLAVRFSVKSSALMTAFLMILYGMWFLPYTYALYLFSISRVPFI